MANVQEIYDMAIHLLDEQSEHDGSTVTDENKEYKFRTISILNTVLPTLAPYNSHYFDVWPYGCFDRGEPTRRACSQVIPYTNEAGEPDFNDCIIHLDDALARALLPLYLAAQLVAEENPERSDRLMARYREVFQDMKNKIPVQFERIRPPYGLF